MQNLKLIDSYNDVRFLFAECANDSWCLHCGAFIGTHGGCLTCLLETMREIRKCPWHGKPSDPHLGDYTVAHLIGVDCGGGKANVIGYIAPPPLHTQLVLFHIVPALTVPELQPLVGYLDTPFYLFYHLPCGSLSQSSPDSLSLPFQSSKLPRWLFQHFLVRAAGRRDALHSWLRPRSLF